MLTSRQSMWKQCREIYSALSQEHRTSHRRQARQAALKVAGWQAEYEPISEVSVGCRENSRSLSQT